MKILVTGGAGFIGSQVADAFIAANHEVAIIDNLSTGIRDNLNPKAKFYELDLEDKAKVDAAMSEFKPEVVVHHAAQVDVRVSVADPLKDAFNNIIASLNLILAAEAVGVKKFVYANSGGAGYGSPKPEDIPCNEDTPMAPIAPYGVSKITVERYLYSRHITNGLNYVALRYGNIYGPRQTFGEAGVCAIFIHKLLHNEPCTIFGDGSQERDYVFVADVVAANLLALTDKAQGPYNVGTSVGTSTQEVFDAVKAATGSTMTAANAPERPGEIQKIILDATRLKTELGWQPSVNFREGVAKTVAWMRSQT